MGYRDSQRFRKVYGYYRPLPRATDTSIVAAQEYIDDVVAGIDWKQSVRAASSSNVNLTAPGNIDGVSLADEDRILLKDQSNAAENGIYIYYTTTNSLIRTKDAEQDTLTSGAAVYVEEGTNNNGTAWILSTPDPITVDSTNQTWVLFSTIYPVFVKSGSYARSTINVSFGNEYTDEIGSNVFFFVSGTIGSTASPQISVFGGDIFASGSLTVKQGLSGSLTKLSDGTSYLIAGTNITITSASNGAVTISSTASSGGDGGDPNASYLVFSATGSLSNEFVITPSTGLTGSGGGGLYTLTIDNSVVATVSGTTFTGVTAHNAGLSGSLTKLTDGTSYLIAGSNVTITSASNGAVTIAAAGTAPGGSDTQVQFNDGGSALGGDSGLTYSKMTDTLSVVNVSMSATSDQVWSLRDNSAGALNIGAGGSNYWTFNTGDSQERLGFWDGVRAAFGDINDPDLNIQHDGTNSRIENKTGQLILSSASGITVSGSTKFINGLSGSLTKLVDGTSYLVAGNNIQVTSSSNGSITITGLASGTSYFDSTTAGSIFTTGSVAIRGGESSVDSPTDKGTNIFFYVSGSINGISSHDKRALFGGDVVISGSLRQGQLTSASGRYSHAEGQSTSASGQNSHAEGFETAALGDYSHAEGDTTTASELGSHAEGISTTASGLYAHAEGNGTTASGLYAHAEGRTTTASGAGSHAQGFLSEAVESYSLAAGIGTIASGSGQNVFGQYNKRGNTTSLLVVGNGSGTNNANRSDVLRVEMSGLQVTGSLGMKGSVTPDEDRLYDLGTPTKRWANVYTGDLHLRNDRGDYTLIEEEEFLSIRFNKTGHRYKFVLERVPELDDNVE